MSEDSVSAIRRLGAAMAANAPSAQRAATAWLGHATLIGGALKMEEIYGAGRNSGLSAREIHEVVTAWLDWYRERPDPTDLRQIRVAVLSRAKGDNWRPPT